MSFRYLSHQRASREGTDESEHIGRLARAFAARIRKVLMKIKTPTNIRPYWFDSAKPF